MTLKQILSELNSMASIIVFKPEMKSYDKEEVIISLAYLILRDHGLDCLRGCVVMQPKKWQQYKPLLGVPIIEYLFVDGKLIFKPFYHDINQDIEPVDYLALACLKVLEKKLKEQEEHIQNLHELFNNACRDSNATLVEMQNIISGVNSRIRKR